MFYVYLTEHFMFYNQTANAPSCSNGGRQSVWNNHISHWQWSTTVMDMQKSCLHLSQLNIRSSAITNRPHITSSYKTEEQLW